MFIYSFRKINWKIQIQKSLFYSDNDSINKFITKENIRTINFYEFNVVIKDKDFDEYFIMLNDKFNNLKNKYGEEKNKLNNKNYNYFPPTYDLISENFHKCFNYNNIKLSQNFIYLDTIERYILSSIHKVFSSYIGLNSNIGKLIRTIKNFIKKKKIYMQHVDLMEQVKVYLH